jgi:hypothetical protein
MMVAFVDFMMNYQTIRCRYTMESIYGKSGFKDFNTFLTTFTSELSSDAYNTELTVVAGFITGIINPQTLEPKQQCSMQGGKRKKNSKRKNKSKRNIRKTKKYRRIM